MHCESIIAMLAQIHAPKTVDALAAYASRWDGRAVTESLAWLQGQGEDSTDAALAQVRQALVARDLPQFQEVHPEWMLRVLECETPRVVAILLRYIPSKQVQYIMDRLPARIKDHLPTAVDVFSVPTPVVQSLRRQFEAHFAGLASTSQAATSGFESLAGLGYDEFPKFLHDLGLHEMAIAFADADPRSLKILSRRLPENDARRLQDRIVHLETVSQSLVRDAKFTILDLDTSAIVPDQFLLEVGLRAFAKACGPQHADLIRALSLKLEPKVGEWLLAQVARKASGGSGEMRRTMVVGRVVILAKAGVLDAKWQLLETGGHESSQELLDAPQVPAIGGASAAASKFLP
jgi:hypothetical protein